MRNLRDCGIGVVIEELELHRLYRTMGWLGEPAAATGAGTAAPASRTRCEPIEERLFERRRDLFTRLDLVFFDTCGRPGKHDGRSRTASDA